MCAVSGVLQWGLSQPPGIWNPVSLHEFGKLYEQAKDFDEKTGQPDCEDPIKAAWYEEMKRKMLQH